MKTAAYTPAPITGSKNSKNINDQYSGANDLITPITPLMAIPPIRTAFLPNLSDTKPDRGIHTN